MAGPDTKNTETPYPIWGFGPPSPEPDTKKLDALLDSLNGSAERFQTLWFSFLGLTLYLAIAALATTHRNLLLGEPQVLPILNIKVELLPFYVIAPLLYLVFHFYLLMMLALLARTAAEFDKQLRTTLSGEPERERYRAQVGNALFLQLLVGMKGERTGVNALLMGLIALITIVLAPLATLVLMQMMFLPYHHLRITWWHRAVVVADFVLIIVMTYRCFFPRGVRKAPLVLGALNRKLRWATAMGFCILLAVALAPLVEWLSFQQGRWAGEPMASSFSEWQGWMAGVPPRFPEINPNYHATENGVVFGLFPDRLKLPEEPVVGEKTLEETKKEIDSRGGDFVPTRNFDGRDLQAAELSGADMRGVALRGAVINDADLSSTRLDGSHLEPMYVGGNFVLTQLNGARLFEARLQGADLTEAQLRGAPLRGAQLQGANLSRAHLQGADLTDAQLQGADLDAELQGANLKSAQLQGANLSSAQLQGADLTDAQLQGADLEFARLQGAVLRGAGLQGAVLRGAGLQGADLPGAELQGADLSGAQLQGARLSGADLAGSSFDGTFVFRAAANAGMAAATIHSARPDKVFMDETGAIETLVPQDVHTWIATATLFALEVDKDAITARFARLEPDFQPPEKDAEDQARWGDLSKQTLALDPDGTQYRRRLAGCLGDLACKRDSAPYVARGLVRNDRLAALGDQLEGVRKRMKEGREKLDVCRGVAGFTEDDWRRLEALRPN
jgi:uncharacterized protein YjbI with pentapeptide repeats